MYILYNSSEFLFCEMDFTALSYYNMTLDDFQDGKFPDVNVTEFLDNIFYQINIDFHLWITIEIKPNVYEDLYVEEGHITDFGVNIVITKVLTFWTGNCYKITFDLDTFQKVNKSRLWKLYYW